MSGRRFPSLLVMKTASIDHFGGMMSLAQFKPSELCDDDLVPGAKTSDLLREAVADFQREARSIIQIGFDSNPTQDPHLTILPSPAGQDFAIIMAWPTRAGACFIASPFILGHVVENGCEFAGFDKAGRVTFFGDLQDVPA